jgi:hypothetical protein
MREIEEFDVEGVCGGVPLKILSPIKIMSLS